MAIGAMRVRKPTMKMGIKGGGAGKLPKMAAAPALSDGDADDMPGGAPGAPPPFRSGGRVGSKGGKARGKC